MSLAEGSLLSRPANTTVISSSSPSFPELSERGGKMRVGLFAPFEEGQRVDFHVDFAQQRTRADRRPRGRMPGEEAPVDFVHWLEIFHVAQIDSTPEDVSQSCSACLEDGIDVLKGQFAFAVNIYQDETPTFRIDGSLARHLNEIARNNSLGIGSLWKRRQLRSDNALLGHPGQSPQRLAEIGLRAPEDTVRHTSSKVKS